MPVEQTGIDFVNRIEDTDTLNILDYLYYYNGGGVAIADINNDGLPDIYFTSNQGSNKLYLNKGQFRFEDITQSSGVQGTGNWKTGVTVADVNGDGWLDIYVCEVGGYKNFVGRNELFINDGNNGKGGSPVHFTEKAQEYGLDTRGFNTQASFFDYDHDDDLDMFLVNHSVHSNSSYGDSSMRRVKDEAAGDKLFRNDAGPTGRKFVEVTTEAGIYSSIIGYGLNVAIADMNNDGWDDIYVSNDFHENDYYYLNNRNGTFSEINREAFGHQSRFSMGSDIADMNNDGWNDIITLDMLPPDEKNLKSAEGDDPYDIYRFKYNYGYYHQYSRNCLQLNRDSGKKFSDIALYAGIAATDWSWSPLAADFDNDGIKDLFISNGILRRPNDLDFLKFYSNAGKKDTSRALDMATIAKMPAGRINNYIFKGTDSLVFVDKTADWGIGEPRFSNGAAYGDLDNDGDLDIVVNNINEAAGIYQNNAAQELPHHFLDISLKGDESNRFAIGAKCVLHQDGRVQTGYLNATRGFGSGALQYIHFGTGKDTVIDLVEVYWPGGKSQMIRNVKAGQLLKLSFSDARLPSLAEDDRRLIDSNQAIFKDISGEVQLPYRHHENFFNDFNIQAFTPHMVSTQGPKLAVADVDGDGLDDLFICGAKGQPGSLFQQTKAGKFIATNLALFSRDAICEDVNALFFDPDNDGDKDLYVVSGGNESGGKDSALLDRLYMNDGKGNFVKSGSLPPFYENKSVAAEADFDKDGDLDLFVGGRVVAGRYGEIPSSYLLINEGKAKFKIAPDSMCPGLRKIGMVTGAVWTDVDQDGWPDLAMAGEWMPVTIFRNQKGKLSRDTLDTGLENTTGLWCSIQKADINNDGFDDLLVGNYGLNSKLHASQRFPLRLYTGDLDNNGGPDQLLALENNGKYYSFLGKIEMEKQLPALLRKKYPDYASFAGQTIDQVFGAKLETTRPLNAALLASVALVNNGKGQFGLSRLPMEMQWSPVFSFLTTDLNGDNATDLIAVGNFYGVLPYEGRYDAGYGTVAMGNGRNSFKTLSPLRSKFIAEGEMRDIKSINLAGRRHCLVIARNNNKPVFIEW